MIPILYTADETAFITNGIGRLSDCTRCVVTEERNGIYEAEFDVPITGAHFDDIQLGRIVALTHDDTGDIQPFVIYRRNVPNLDGIVTFNAHHISYRLGGISVMPYSAGSVAAALEGISNNSVNTNPFTFWTDKITAGTFESATPRNARNILGGEENSILDVFGSGDYEFDKFAVKLHAQRGTDSDVEIRYSKNLVELNETIDDSGLYNAIVPYWTDSEGNIVTLPEKILVYSGVTPKTAYLTDENLIIIREENGEPIEVTYYDTISQPMDLSDAFEEIPTVEELRNAARARFENSDAWLPSENLEIDFVQLWQTAEFEEYSALQRVSLCDTVSVYYPQIGLSKVKQRVVKTVYNVLLDRYDLIELGQVSTTFGQTLREGILKEVPTTSMMDAAIKYATDMIRGGLGGYVVMTPGPNGYPQEILIMDAPDINTAVNVWRFNQGGLGHSSNGYEGPYSDIALTQDGKINASMITTGILNANVIRAGLIQDATGKNSWNLDTGLFSTKRGYIGNFDISESGLITETYRRRAVVSASEGISFAYVTSFDSSNIEINQGSITFYYQENNGTEGTLNPSRAAFVEGRETSLWFYVDDGSEVLISKFALTADYGASLWDDFWVSRDFSVGGTKSRRVETDNYAGRLLYCYETPTPLFGDIGEAIIDEDGFGFVDIDDIFSETVAEQVEYQVFLQKEGKGDCWINDKTPRYFVIEGTPGLKVAWELKGKQKNYQNIRLEQSDNDLDEYEKGVGTFYSLNDYINETEALLYGDD